MAVFG